MSDSTVESLESDDSKTVILTSKDGKSFKMSEDIAKVSKLVETAISGDDTTDERIVPLSVTSDDLARVVHLMRIMDGKELKIVKSPLVYKNYLENFKSEDKIGYKIANYIQKLDTKQLYSLILTLNYMDVKALLHNACAKVGSMIKGEPIEKFVDILKV
jgi:hypothetical protein